jgi:hypothetical protein
MWRYGAWEGNRLLYQNEFDPYAFTGRLSVVDGEKTCHCNTQPSFHAGCEFYFITECNIIIALLLMDGLNTWITSETKLTFI